LFEQALPCPEQREDVLGQLKVQRFIAVLRLIYSCGLRLGEAVAVEVRDIDAALGRLHIRDGKGGKERVV
jgi:integrase/recombinase XerD